MTLSPPPSPGRRVTRFAWLAASQVVARGIAFVVLVFLARVLELEEYGVYVVLAAILAAGTFAWNATVQQSVAARFGAGGRQEDWTRHLRRWAAIGLVAAAPFAWLVAGWQSVAAVVFAGLAETLMMRSIPRLILDGEQRRLAFGTTTSQIVRFGTVLALYPLGVLTPTTAVAAHGLGFIAGAIAQGRATSSGNGAVGPLRSELAVEAMRWVENYAPIVGVAVFVGFATAAGFDLMLKLALAVAEIVAAIGIVFLPDMVGGKSRVRESIARLRIPLLASAIAAVAYAVFAQPVLEGLTGQSIGLGLVPIALAVVLLLAPWTGVSRSALLAGGAPGWLVPSQIASASWTLIGGLVAPFGVIWSAAATAAAHATSGAIRWIGLRRLQLLPRGRELLSVQRLRDDLRTVTVERRSSAQTEEDS